MQKWLLLKDFRTDEDGTESHHVRLLLMNPTLARPEWQAPPFSRATTRSCEHVFESMTLADHGRHDGTVLFQ
ncbi:hypothetical protein AB0F91_11865 [Amycolatopsis sp. NPDC023774]|uniref:hypothetical protein n=1 Tax=Amycolatopsis sp. NPDC023774 TaxID=3155015 RepID=UPI0033F29792